MKKPTAILLVEDDPECSIATSYALSDWGFEVLTAETADGALEIVSARDDLAAMVTDIRLPGEADGLELLQIIKAKNKDFPVIMITGYSDIETAARACRSGADDYIIKPFEGIEALAIPLSRVTKNYKRLIRNRELEKELQRFERYVPTQPIPLKCKQCGTQDSLEIMIGSHSFLDNQKPEPLDNNWSLGY